jgi:hypothetical protein
VFEEGASLDSDVSNNNCESSEVKMLQESAMNTNFKLCCHSAELKG